ncbi:MAG: type IV pilus modification protein PilV [Pseudomonadota bacterium]
MRSAPIRLFHHSRRHAGFSLVEVLVSVFVLTIGLVGTAVIQLNAFRTTEQSGFHNTAVALAMQIADEIRTNSEQMRLPISPFNRLRFDAKNGEPKYSPPVNCYSETCTPRDWATHSIAEWRKQAFATLPGVRLEICRDALVVDPDSGEFRWCTNNLNPFDAPLVVKISWDEKDPSGKIVAANTPRVVILVSPFSQ